MKIVKIIIDSFFTAASFMRYDKAETKEEEEEEEEVQEKIVFLQVDTFQLQRSTFSVPAFSFTFTRK